MANQISFFDVFKMLLILVVILFCTYYVTKLLAAKAAGGGSKGFFSLSGNDPGGLNAPRVIHRMMVDKDSKLLVVEYNGCDYLLAMTAGAIQVLEKRELSDEEIAQRENTAINKQQMGFSFAKHLEKFKNSQSDGGEE